MVPPFVPSDTKYIDSPILLFFSPEHTTACEPHPENTEYPMIILGGHSIPLQDLHLTQPGPTLHSSQTLWKQEKGGPQTPPFVLLRSPLPNQGHSVHHTCQR